MNYETLVRGPLKGDIRFQTIVKSIMDFAGEQTCLKQFAKKETYCLIRGKIEYQFAHIDNQSKYNILLDLETMISYLPPKLKKIVHKYYEHQITLYCQGLRGFSKEISGYPYKSDNVVDLLEEVDKVYNDKKNDSYSAFSAKPFRFSNTGYLSDVYLPQKGVWNDQDGNRECMCVHMCKKFLTYPADSYGVKCIPEDAKCEGNGQRCCGAYIFKNGVNTGVIKDLVNNKYSADTKTKSR